MAEVKAPAPPAEGEITVNLGGTPAAAEGIVAPPPQRRRKRTQAAHHEDLERWLLTYCDLITLLMAIFVILYAGSRMKEGTKGISVEAERIKNIQAREKTFLPVIPDAEVRKLERLRIQIDALKKMKKIGPFIHLTKSPRGLVISLPGSLLYDSGSAVIKDKAKQAIDILVPSLQSVPNHIRVEGHTDNVPIHTEAYPSNWHLSTARAISIVDYLVHQHKFDQDRFSALGYADLKPLVPNTTEANRAKNRRVDVVVVYEHSPQPARAP